MARSLGARVRTEVFLFPKQAGQPLPYAQIEQGGGQDSNLQVLGLPNFGLTCDDWLDQSPTLQFNSGIASPPRGSVQVNQLVMAQQFTRASPGTHKQNEE